METKETDLNQNNSTKSRLSQSDIPVFSLKEALRIAHALRDSYALQSATPLQIGKAIGIAPTSGKFRSLTGSAIAYGLTNGGYNASEISLTDLGRRVVAPYEEGDDQIALLEAFEKPRIIKEFVGKYNENKIPSKEIAQSVLERMGIQFDATERVYNLLYESFKELNYLEEINGSKFLQRPKMAGILKSNTTSQEPDESHSEEPSKNLVNQDYTPPLVTPSKPSSNAIFLGHGKNKNPLEQLIKILDEYGIPHKEAMYEANAGKPIPTKVADTMRECGAAILIFSADEKFLDEHGVEIWRPSENVIHELGAASVLYDSRIIIFKEKLVSLASNFESIGHITFEKDKLGDKGIELFRELVNFNLVKISVAG